MKIKKFAPILLVLFAACQKQNQQLLSHESQEESLINNDQRLIAATRVNNNSSSGINIPISKEEYEKISKLPIATMDSAEFMTQALAIHNSFAQANTLMTAMTTADGGDYSAGTDGGGDMGSGGIYSVTDGLIPPGDYSDYGNRVHTYNTSLRIPMTFAIRHNAIIFDMPFSYTVGAGGSVYELIGLAPVNGKSPQILPTTGVWGQVVQGENRYVNAFYNGDNSGTLQAQGEATETRTEILTTDNHMELSANANIEAFGVGTKLSDGQTVQSASNTYNQYSATGQYKITIDPVPTNSGSGANLPFSGITIYPNYLGSASAEDAGILRDH